MRRYSIFKILGLATFQFSSLLQAVKMYAKTEAKLLCSARKKNTEWLPSIPQSKIEYSLPTKEGKIGDAKSIYMKLQLTLH